MTDPICATCHPAAFRPGEVVGTMWRCPEHQAGWDGTMAGPGSDVDLCVRHMAIFMSEPGGATTREEFERVSATAAS